MIKHLGPRSKGEIKKYFKPETTKNVFNEMTCRYSGNDNTYIITKNIFHDEFCKRVKFLSANKILIDFKAMQVKCQYVIEIDVYNNN